MDVVLTGTVISALPVNVCPLSALPGVNTLAESAVPVNGPFKVPATAPPLPAPPVPMYQSPASTAPVAEAVICVCLSRDELGKRLGILCS